MGYFKISPPWDSNKGSISKLQGTTSPIILPVSHCISYFPLTIVFVFYFFAFLNIWTCMALIFSSIHEVFSVALNAIFGEPLLWSNNLWCFCILYAIKGGSVKTSSKYWSVIFIVLLCFFLMAWSEGSRGPNIPILSQ